MSPEHFVIGVDYGTLSGRAVVVRVGDGAELGEAVHEFPNGVIEERLPASGAPSRPTGRCRIPRTTATVLRHAGPAALAASGVDPRRVVGVGVDFTACTVLPVLRDGTPLCELAEFRERPHAYVKLWKHHAAQSHADRINALAHERGEPWIARYGGKISSEWQFAKALQLLEEDPEIFQRAERWIEATDWITWQLTGTESRNACTAGYKGIYQDGHYPSAEFLAALNPGLPDLIGKLEHPLAALGSRVGSLTAQAAGWTGLPEGIAVCAGNVDAHVTAPAAQAVEPGQMLMVMGTSTCHIMNGRGVAEVTGMCGTVDGGVIAGAWGFEAGQSGVGDIFAWYVDHNLPPAYHDAARERGVSVHTLLAEEAAKQPVGGHGLVALDWHNGNRSILVDHELSGVLVGATLATRPPEIYRALIEATAFGTRRIIDAFEDAGVPVNELVIAGGLVKNPFLMQIYADITRRSLSLSGSAQAPALGSAIHAAVAAGAYADVPTAAKAMGKVERDVYRPDPERADAYEPLYAAYRELHDYFGQSTKDSLLHRLRRIRNEARGHS